MPKKIRIAINGFGRIGRILTRVIWDNPNFELVAINSRSKCDIYAHLLKFDSIYGPWDKKVEFENNDFLVINDKKIRIFHEDEVLKAPWHGQNIDIVVESTGVFKDRKSSEKHLEAGAKCVVISAPAKDEDITMIYGVNHDKFEPQKHKIISAASCTTTCLAPVSKVLNDNFKIKHGTVVTTHAYTNDQHLVDHPHKSESFRRSRAAAMSIIPTSTGAAKAIGKVVPDLAGKMDGNALRVPIAVPSVISLVVEVEKQTNIEEVNSIFKNSIVKYPGSLDVSDLGLVSADYIRSPYGAVVDSLSTQVVDKTMVFVQAWYDNEWGYVTQMARLLEYVGNKVS